MEHLTELYLSLLARALDGVQIDWLMIWEDMAYKGASIISPKHVREFMLPRYRRITDFVQSKGCDIIMIDSDGDVTELVPLWLEVGINTIHPAEVAAGVDVVALRKRYSELRIKGGIDKREIAKDKKAIEQEVMSKVPFLLERGGFIPEIDHGIPPDISFENFCYYRNLIKKIAEGACSKSL
jgi:uroporphyrinogen decarboxylase